MGSNCIVVNVWYNSCSCWFQSVEMLVSVHNKKWSLDSSTRLQQGHLAVMSIFVAGWPWVGSQRWTYCVKVYRWVGCWEFNARLWISQSILLIVKCGTFCIWFWKRLGGLEIRLHIACDLEYRMMVFQYYFYKLLHDRDCDWLELKRGWCICDCAWIAYYWVHLLIKAEILLALSSIGFALE